MKFPTSKLLKTLLLVFSLFSTLSDTAFASGNSPYPNSEIKSSIFDIQALNLVSVNPTAICQGGLTSVTYTNSGFPVGTSFVAELSNSAGSFAVPTNLGTLGVSPSNVTIPVTASPSIGYQIRIRASDGTFSNTLSLTVKKLPNPFITPSGTASICAGQAANLTAHPTSNANSYNWFFNNNPTPGATNLLSVNTPGSYSVQVDSLGCSRTSAPVLVSNQPVPNAFISGNPNVVVCKNGLIPIPLTLNANTGASLAYQWFNGVNPVTPNGTSANLVISASGTYTVRVTNTTTGCSAISSAVNAVEAQVPPVPSAGLDSAVCSEGLVVAGFQPPPGNTSVFNWVPPVGVLDFFTQQPSPNSPYVFITLTNNTNIPYDSIFTLFARDPATGCFSKDEVKIIANPNPDVTVGLDRSVCENGSPIALVSTPPPGSTPVGVIPAGTGIWSGTGITVTGSNAIFTPNPGLVGANTLEFEYRYDWRNGGKICRNTDDMVVNVVDSPELVPGDPMSFCNGIDSVQLTGFSPAGGVWSGQGVSATGKFYPSSLPIGPHVITYTVKGPGPLFCTNSATRTITVTAAAVVEAGQISQSICSNANPKQLVGNSPPGGVWSGTHTSSGGVFVPDSSIAGIHIIRYTFTKDGCTSRDSIFMTVVQAPKVRLGRNDSVCANDSVKPLLGATPPGGRWKGPGVDTSGTLFTPSPSLVGPQVLMYKISLNGCPDSAVRIMFVKQAPVVEAGRNDTICASVDSLKLAGFSPAIGKWTGPGVDSIGIFRPKKFSLIGNILLTYKVKSSNGCTSSDQKQVTVNALPLAQAGIDTALCTGDKIQIGKTRLPKLNYLWFEPVPNSISEDTLANPFLSIVNNLQIPDTFSVRLRVIDSVTKCQNRDTIRVIVYPRPTAIVSFPGVKAKCAGDTFTLKAKTKAGLTYEWVRNGLSLNVPSVKDSVLKASNSGRYVLVVRNLGANCTDSSDSDSLTILPRFIPKVKGLRFFCKDSTTQLFVDPQNEGFSYQWQYNGVNVPDSTKTTFTIGQTGTVRVILRTDRGCIDSSLTVPIDSLPFPFIGVLNDTTICEDGLAIFKAPDDSLFTYKWTDSIGTVLSLDDTLRTRKVGKYFLTVSNSCRVVNDTVSLVTIHPLPQFSILAPGRPDTIVCVDLPVRLYGPEGYEEYVWKLDTLKSVSTRFFDLLVSDTTRYPLQLKITDEFGCSNQDTVGVKVIDCPPQIYAPTAFTPDNNKINDVWRLQGYDIQEFKLYVFNRWGQLVYYSENIDQGWDGTYNGTPCPSGAYKYHVEYLGTLDGEDVPKKESGTVTIIR